MSQGGWRADFADSPLFHGLASHAGLFAGHADWPELDDLNRQAGCAGLTNARGIPLCFAEQSERCSQHAYEDGIYATGQVPTRRHSWHDFFNALIWLAWPRTKAALNRCQQQALSAAPAGRRGALSDAATLFDESGLVLVAPDARLADLLRARHWHEAFWEARALWPAARLYVVGHSLLEKSLQALPGITGKCLFVQAETRDMTTQTVPGWLDDQVASCWQSGVIQRPESLFPIPLMGVPGYDPANAAPDYYDNPRVFRAPPRATSSAAPT